MDEIADLVEMAKLEEESGDGEEETATATAKGKRKRRSSNGGKDKAGVEKTMEELDVEGLLPPELPKPGEVVKTIGDLYAKYGVGDNPDFRVQVWRTWPKMAPGGKKFDGFYDTWDIPISYEQIQADYGGGQFRIVVVGPHPSKPNTPKHYESLSISLGGEPNYNRVPRALQGKADVKKDDASGFQIPSPVGESPKLAEAALKMMQSTAESERSERRRIEDRAEQQRVTAGDAMQPVIEAERRRSDDVIRAERERSQAERQMMDERFREEREESRELKRRMESIEGNRPSIGAEIAALANAGLFKSGDDGMARDMLTQILEKHRGEMDALGIRNTQFIESLRSGHASEISAIRDAHRREMEAEREASRSRESRIEERLGSEREERRRDQDRFKEQIGERDIQWRDRMDSAKETLSSSWESRHQALISTYENRLQWMQGELDRVKSELLDAKAKQEERGDVLTQLSKVREIQDVLKGFAPETTTASSGGGIGLSGGADWKDTLAEGLTERAPELLQRILGGAGGEPQAAPQQQYQEGQVVQTPQGPMVVVRDPANGQLALAPKAAIEAHQRAVAAQQKGGQGLLSGGAQGRRPRVMPDAGDMRERKSRRRPSAVQNLAAGLPRPVPPWEGGDDDEDAPGTPQAPPAPPTPASAPRMTSRSRREVAEGSAGGAPMELSAQERHGLQIIAKAVHESVMEAEEPEEFVAKMMNQYEPGVLMAIVGSYTTEQIARGIAQVAPGGAGATPAGQHFVAAAFAQLRDALRSR